MILRRLLRRTLFALLLLGAWLALGTAIIEQAAAAPPAHAPAHGYRGENCPPPWAPAHGFRRKHPECGPAQGKKVHEVEIEQPTAPWPSDTLGTVNVACNRDKVGGVIGGIVGAVAGAQIGDGTGQKVATTVGTVAGYVVGSEVGRWMDEVDRRCTGQVLENAPDRQTVAWNNPDSGEQYAVTPVRTFQNEAGRFCRDYRVETTENGRPRDVFYTACRDENGRWQVVD